MQRCDVTVHTESEQMDRNDDNFCVPKSNIRSNDMIMLCV
jgi:hypothetical protein